MALIPLSAFFTSGTPDTYVRFAFCKQQTLMEEAAGAAGKHVRDYMSGEILTTRRDGRAPMPMRWRMACRR